MKIDGSYDVTGCTYLLHTHITAALVDNGRCIGVEVSTIELNSHG